MITVKPFQAVRPTRDKAYLLATRSYVSYTNEELEEKLANNPFSFFHVICPDKEQEMSGAKKFEMVRNKFEDFLKERIFLTEDKAAFYIYQQVTPTHVFNGIIGTVSINDYRDGKVKKHEHTLTSRENLFAEYLSHTGFNAEPVLLTHKPVSSLAEVKSKYLDTRAEYEFTSTDKILHLLWPVFDEKDIEIIEESFKTVEELYIADGHHRCASSTRLNEIIKDNEKSEYFMAYLLPETYIKIREFNRMVKNLNGLTKEEFLKKLDEDFYVSYINQDKFYPSGLHEMGVYLDNDWYSLFAKPGTYNPEDPVDQLDCKIVSDNILNKILGISDEREDPNVSFMPGVKGVAGVKKAVDSGKFEVGITLFPITIEQVKQVADAGMYMPPKSTYIEPKLRSGLTIYKFE